MFFYAIENPYGISTLNRDGNQPNILRLFIDKRFRNMWVWDDPEHRERIDSKAARRIIDGTVKAGGPPDRAEYPYLER